MAASTDDAPRLRALRDRLRETTAEAHALLAGPTSTVAGNPLRDDDDGGAPADGGGNGRGRDVAGQEAGLALFGTSESYRRSVEDEFESRLSGLEDELDGIRGDIGRSSAPGEGGATAAEGAGPPGGDRYSSVTNVEFLRRHVGILRRCRTVKGRLDGIDALSLTGFAPSSIAAAPPAGRNFDSPSSVTSSPSDFARFAFPSSCGDSSAEDGSPLVRAAELASRAKAEIDGASGLLAEMEGLRSGGEANGEEDAAASSDRRLVGSLAARVRRCEAELVHRASSVVGQCLVVECGDGESAGGGTTWRIAVRGSNTRVQQTSAGADDEFDLSTPRGGEELAASPLGDAYRVLELFGSLDGTMDGLSRRLYEGALGPALDALDGAFDADPSSGFEVKSEEVPAALVPPSGAGRFGPVVRGPAARLSLTLRPGGDGAAKKGGADNPGLASFGSAVDLVSSALGFVQSHLLLGRPSLARALGRHLLGDGARTGGPAAGFGAEAGGRAPLTARLVAALRKRCVPPPLEEGAWETVLSNREGAARIASGLEGRLSVLGYMDGSPASLPPAEMASSPAGLSVLVDGSDVGSPIDRAEDATIAGLSAIDTTLGLGASLPSPSADRTDSTLSRLANDLAGSYLESLRSSVLNRARDVLLGTDYHDTLRVGTEVPDPSDPGTPESADADPSAAFAFPLCSVSVTASKSLELVRETLGRAAAPGVPPAVAGVLYRSAREVLDLFRAIVPARHAGEARSLPRTAAVLHDDMVYLAHHCCLLGAEYKLRFRDAAGSTAEGDADGTRALGDAVTFVDMVPPFREGATKVMGAMVEAQKGQIYELVAPRLANFEAGLASDESVSEWDDAESALRASMHHLRHLSRTWSPVLPRRVYHAAVGDLAELVLVLLLGPVLAAREVAEPASRFVHSLLLDAAGGAAGLFLPADGTAGGVGGGDGGRRAAAGRHTPSLGRVEAVGNFMRMNLDEVRRGLEGGTFRCVTARELSGLVSATFDESERRAAMLSSLAAG